MAWSTLSVVALAALTLSTAGQNCDPSSNLIQNGGFEEGWNSPWRGLGQGATFPGWTVTHGNIDFGDYRTGGHCNQPCAAEGSSMLDICGNQRGGIEQVVNNLVVGGNYRLQVRYSAHATCSRQGSAILADVKVDGAGVGRLRHAEQRTWDLQWSLWSYDFVASSSSHSFQFDSVSSLCGCMLLDDVQLKCQSPPTLTTTTVVTQTTHTIGSALETNRAELLRLQNEVLPEMSRTLESRNLELARALEQAETERNQMASIIADLSQQVSDVQANAADNSAILGAIRSAVQTISTNIDPLDPSVCSGVDCRPSIESVGNNVVVNVRRGSAQLRTSCGTIDICEDAQAVRGLIQALLPQ